MAVFPSPDSETEEPCCASAYGAGADQFGPCWLHTPPERVNTHAAPAWLLSPGPPTMAVFPSPESETEQPCTAAPTAPVPTSFALLAPHPARARVHPRGAGTAVVTQAHRRWRYSRHRKARQNSLALR